MTHASAAFTYRIILIPLNISSGGAGTHEDGGPRSSLPVKKRKSQIKLIFPSFVPFYSVYGSWGNANNANTFGFSI